MNEKINKKTLKELKNILLSGKVSQSIEEDSLIAEEFNSLFLKVREYPEDEFLSDYLTDIQEIFNIMIASDLLEELIPNFNENNLYDFSSYLLNLKSIEQKRNINSTIHSLLFIFHFSAFLKKISGLKHWEKIISELIIFSNYSVSVMFMQRVNYYKEKALFKVFKGNHIESYSWIDVKKKIILYGNSLKVLLKNTESAKIAFLLENSPDMVFLDLASLVFGFVNIMIPANSVSEHIKFILNQTESKILFVHDEKLLSKIRLIKNELKYLDKVVLISGEAAEDWIILYKNYLSLTDSENLNNPESEIDVETLSTVMYTSGTTGEPKGIMFSQANIVYKRFCRALALPEIGKDDRFLAYLPLFHTFGRWLEMMGSIFWGAEYIFMENPSIETLLSNMKLVKPTVFISVPKKWIQLYEFITGIVNVETESEEKIENVLKEHTGGELKWGLSAAGYLSPEIFMFFQKYSIELMSGFGMTEATGGITMTPPGSYIPNSLGKALPGIDIKLAEDGELLIKGDYVMLGYYGQSKEETFSDDWFPTGDIMVMDEKGFIEIVDRKKEIYKNSKGETIAPQKIENYFRDFDFVKSVFLVGDHRPFNTLLIFPNFDEENSVFLTMTPQQLKDFFSSVVVTVNRFLAPFERIVDFRIIDRTFSDEFGELTPKGTFKRKVIEQNFYDTIESMYKKDYITIFSDIFEINIPNWFLREKGVLGDGIIFKDDELVIPKHEVSLKIKKYFGSHNLYKIGNYTYQINGDVIDLQNLLVNPAYWLGNHSLYNFAGESITRWYRQDSSLKTMSIISSSISDDHLATDLKDLLKKEVFVDDLSIVNLHYIFIVIQMGIEDLLDDAFIKIEKALRSDNQPIIKFTLRFLEFPFLSANTETRRKLFMIGFKYKKITELKSFISLFMFYEIGFLNNEIIDFLAGQKYDEKFISIIEELISDEISKENILNDNEENTNLKNLLNLLTHYGIAHPKAYEWIRQIFVALQIVQSAGISTMTKGWRKQLREGFRGWLGEQQTIAIDSETGEEYNWSNVITFEDEINSEDKNRIEDAIINSQLIKEAVFLFSKGSLISLSNILPNGIWISFLRSHDNKTIYRATIQTRYQGSFEITICLNKTGTIQNVLDEVNWLILAGSRAFVKELVEDFGGYWEQYDLWTQKYIQGESVSKYLARETKKKEEFAITKIKNLWPFFVWNAAAAYTNFWKLTGLRLRLINPFPENLIIPPHDYQTGTRFISLSEREEAGDVYELFANFYSKFVLSVTNEYEFLKDIQIYNHIFSGIINALGENKGLETLKIMEEILNLKEETNLNKEIKISLSKFVASVEKNGFITKQLYFAIKRFHRWIELNSNADIEAQAQTLYDLYETYLLDELEKKYSETRTRFFTETVFQDSGESLKRVLYSIIKHQYNGQISNEEAIDMISNMLHEFDLSEKEKYFLTRLSYPHLKPQDSAELLKIKSEGSVRPNLVVKYEDYDGNEFTVRAPISPKEISKLHQLFLDTNLEVAFKAEHNFLVAVSERGYIIGGLFYYYSDNNSVHMEKIVVTNRYRRKGIGDALLNDLANRLKSQKINYMTTGFFRPEYFYKFGFKIESKYSGLVKELK